VLLEEAVRVPLIFSMPRMIQPSSIAAPVSQVDVFATIFSFLNISGLDRSDGMSLRRFIDGSSYNQLYEEGTAVVELDKDMEVDDTDAIPNFMIRYCHWKLILPKNSDALLPDMLFNLRADPWETNNLLGNKASNANDAIIGKAEQLKCLLIEWLKRHEGQQQYYSRPQYNYGVGAGMITEIAKRRTWETVPIWISDTTLSFEEPVWTSGGYLRNEWLYLGRSRPGNLTIRDVYIGGAHAQFFDVDKRETSVTQYTRIRVSFQSSGPYDLSDLDAYITIVNDVNFVQKVSISWSDFSGIATDSPSMAPSQSPTISFMPSMAPTSSGPSPVIPSQPPSSGPSLLPSANPSSYPSVSFLPSYYAPSGQPTFFPSTSPSESLPSASPSSSPTWMPSPYPSSSHPSSSPTNVCESFNKKCTNTARCCGPLVCDYTGTGKRCRRCKEADWLCTRSSQCCEGLVCRRVGQALKCIDPEVSGADKDQDNKKRGVSANDGDDNNKPIRGGSSSVLDRLKSNEKIRMMEQMQMMQRNRSPRVVNKASPTIPTGLDQKNSNKSPSVQPSPVPSSIPSREPSSPPSHEPSAQPTSAFPSPVPSSQPTTDAPSSSPTPLSSSSNPTDSPSTSPSNTPSQQPSSIPSKAVADTRQTCISVGKICRLSSSCCGSSIKCVLTPTGVRRCQRSCKVKGLRCKRTSECCTGIGFVCRRVRGTRRCARPLGMSITRKTKPKPPWRRPWG